MASFERMDRQLDCMLDVIINYTRFRDLFDTIQPAAPLLLRHGHSSVSEPNGCGEMLVAVNISKSKHDQATQPRVNFALCDIGTS